MKMPTDRLKGILQDIISVISTGDSFEGTLTYSCMEEGLSPGEWEVTASYRIGNSTGQGGSVIINPTQHEREPEGSR